MKRTGRTLPLLLGLLLVQTVLVVVVFTPGAFPGGDNAGYIALADALVEQGSYVELWEPGAPQHTKYPPVLAALLAIPIALGAQGWVALKLIPALAAIGVAGVTFLWARRRVPEGIAAGVSLVTGASTTLLYHASFILSDVPFLLFLMAAFALLDPSRPGVERGGEVAGDPGARSAPHRPTPIFLAGIALILLAGFTRTAGFPLFAAFLGVLLLRRSWAAAGVAGIAFGLPSLLWLLRSGSEEGRYGSEFFLVNPYDPALGRIEVADLLSRAFSNAGGYLGTHLPAALGGIAPGDSAVGLGAALVVSAAVGWVLSFRDGAGLVELFTPLYLGLILVWPEVWSGERFALPLVPILLLYATIAVGAVGGRVGGRVPWVAQGALLLLMGLAALSGVGELRAEAERCREVRAANDGDAWSCSGAGQLEFVEIARWAGAFLPDGSVVLSRKPRIFYLESGLPSRVYPFEAEPAALFREAETLGARYLVFDRVSVQAARFLGPALIQHPERFCGLVSARRAAGDGATQLLAILPEGEPSGSLVEGGSLRLASCPSGMGGGAGAPPTPGGKIPILRD